MAVRVTEVHRATAGAIVRALRDQKPGPAWEVPLARRSSKRIQRRSSPTPVNDPRRTAPTPERPDRRILGAVSAYRGFRRQALYALWRLLEEPQHILQPDRVEDLAVWDQGVLVEVVQVKSLAAPLVLWTSTPGYRDRYSRLPHRVAKEAGPSGSPLHRSGRSGENWALAHLTPSPNQAELRSSLAPDGQGCWLSSVRSAVAIG